MPSFTNLTPTTELEAFNAVLSAMGEAPVADVDAVTASDHVMARSILRQTCKDILSEGWKFNTEFGYELTHQATQAWTGSDGSSATLRVFEVPANLIRFDVSPNSEQRELDLVARKGRTYDPTKIIFYDRARNRDGLDQAKHSYLYIDAVWFFDFAQLPETIRHLIVITAARRAIGQLTNSELVSGFTAQDEMDARRRAKRDQGQQDSHNFLNEMGTNAILGRRLAHGSGRVDRRSPPGAF